MSNEGSNSQFTVRVEVRPRDRGQLTLSQQEAAAALREGFGAPCLDVVDVATRDGSWSATVVLDAKRSEHEALLTKNSTDERLVRSWVESLYAGGTCTVVA